MKCFAILKDGRHPAFGRMLAISKLTELGGKIALPVAELQRGLYQRKRRNAPTRHLA